MKGSVSNSYQIVVSHSAAPSVGRLISRHRVIFETELKTAERHSRDCVLVVVVLRARQVLH